MLVATYLLCPEPTKRNAAYEAALAALLAAGQDPSLRAIPGRSPADTRQCDVHLVLLKHLMAGDALQPYHWDMQGLEEGGAAELDVWLVAVFKLQVLGRSIGGMRKDPLWELLGRCTGWGALRGWSLAYALKGGAGAGREQQGGVERRLGMRYRHVVG